MREDPGIDRRRGTRLRSKIEPNAAFGLLETLATPRTVGVDI